MSTINVKHFGARGDGVSDDTAAIQAAIDAAETAPVPGTEGTTVFFPAGRYLVSSTILFHDDTTLVGAGGGQSTDLRTATNMTLLRAKDAGVSSTNRVVFRDLFLAGNVGAVTTGVGLDLTDVSQAYVENVTAYRMGTGFLLGKSSVSAIYNRFTSCEAQTCVTGWDIGNEANNTWILASRVVDTPRPFVFNGCNSCAVMGSACETNVVTAFDLGTTTAVSDICIFAARVEGAATGFLINPGSTRTAIMSPHFSSVSNKIDDRGTDTLFLYAPDMRMPGPDVHTGVESQAPIANTFNNYALGKSGSTIRMTPFPGGTTFRGFTDGSTGRRVRVINVGEEDLVFSHQNSNAAVLNRFIIPTGMDVTVPSSGTLDLEYDAVTGRWRVVNMLP